LTLTDYQGRVIVLNVWASWCAPCRAEAPVLQGAWAEHESDGVQVIGLNTRDTDVAARAFVQTFDITFPSVVDADGRIQLLFRDSLPPQAIPSTLLIDQQGRVAARILGEATDASLGSLIDALLEEGAAPSATAS
jgi:thiol-disulfide isomerase/thioredoxin